MKISLWIPVLLILTVMTLGCASTEGIKIGADEWFPKDGGDKNGFRVKCDEGEAIIVCEQEGDDLIIRKVLINEPNGVFDTIGDGKAGKVIIKTADKTIMNIRGSVGLVLLDSVDHNRVYIRGDGIVLLRGSSSWNVIEDTSCPRDGYTRGLQEVSGPMMYDGERNIFRTFSHVGGVDDLDCIRKEYNLE